MGYAGKRVLGKPYSRLMSCSYIDPFLPRQLQALEKPVGFGPVPIRLPPLRTTAEKVSPERLANLASSVPFSY